MSLMYCYHCLERADECVCSSCDGDCLPDVVYGELDRAYLKGYRDAKSGEEENI